VKEMNEEEIEKDNRKIRKDKEKQNEVSEN